MTKAKSQSDYILLSLKCGRATFIAYAQIKFTILIPERKNKFHTKVTLKP